MKSGLSMKEIACTVIVAALVIILSSGLGATQNETKQNVTLPENIITSEYVAELNETPSENITDVTAPIQTLQTPDNATDNTSVIGLNYTVNESIGESRTINVTESVIGTPKLIANKESFSLDEEPAFSFEYKTFRKTFIKNASHEMLRRVNVSEDSGIVALEESQKALKKWVTENETIETFVYDSSGDLTDIAPEIAKTCEGKFAIELPKEQAFRAGIYKLSVRLMKDEHVYVLESEFPWGLVSVNTRKSIYKPGETVEFVIVVLDKAGHSVSNADISLTVNNPESDKTTYSIADGTITTSSESGIYNVDYPSEIEGNHTVSVTGLIDNVEVFFTTYFRVLQAYEFDLVRTAQSKIDPTLQDRFEVRIDVESLTDAESVTLKEFVPAEFCVYSTDAATIMQEGDTKTITWNKELIGKKTSVSYSYAVPSIWPYLYALGPAEISHGTETFTEARPWYVAVDPISIINVQSYPAVCGNWSVKFETTGRANLTITAVNGTAWSDTNEDNDLKFLKIQCGDKTVDYEWASNSVFIENYECNETGYEISKVLTAGSHHLKFQFGSDVEYAHNWATDLSNWSYRQNFSISNTAGDLSYYQVKIELNASNVGSNWNWSNNGNDTRFTYYNSSTETETEIPFWIESRNSSANNSTIWVNVTSVANNTDTTIYMYYGNSNASSASNGTNTFGFFDDFDNINDWEGVLFYSSGSNHSTISTIDGKLRIVSTGSNRAGACTKVNQLSQGQRFESKLVTRSGSANLIQMLYHSSQDNLYENIVYNSGGYDVWKVVSGSASHIYDGSGDGVDVTCYPYVEYRTNNYLHFGARSCGEKINDNSSWDDTNFKLAFYSYALGTMEIDWVFVHKYASPEPSVSLGGTVISSHTPSKQLQIQDERGASYKQSYPYLQKSRTLNTSATLSSTDGVGGVRFIVDQGEAGETIVNDTNTADTFFSAQFSGLSYGNHTLDIIILNTSLVPLSGAGQIESIAPFWIVPYIIQFIGDSITISYADDTTCTVLNRADVTSSCNAVTSENSLELPCWDNDAVVSRRAYSNGIHIFYSDYAKSIYGTYVFGNNEAQSGITAEGTHDKFQSNNNGYADRFTSLDENSSNANMFGPTHAYVMLGPNDKRTGVTEATYEAQLSNVVNDTHNKGISYENITLLYPTYSLIYDVSNYLDNIDNVSNTLGTRLITDLYNETKDNYDSGKSWYSGDNLHFTRAGSRNISRIIVEQSTWLGTGEATYTEFSSPETTDFNNLPDITNVSGATLHIANTAKITWYNNVNAYGANFDTNVDFGFAIVNVNSTGLNSTFNSSANVTLYNLPWSETPAIFEDGSPCPDCTINFYSGGNLSFNVTHFTNYSAGVNANLTIWDDTDPEGGSQTKYSGNQIKFYANYTNKTSGQSINGSGVYCNISFNVTPNGPFGMTFNASSLLYEYNRSFSSSGTFNWNVTCNSSVQGYEGLNVTDTVTISTTNNYIPPDPTNLANTTGNFWVNHTWSAGSGNVTDSYNVSVNGVWHNGTTNTYWNVSYLTQTWQNITVYAYNTSVTGTLSAGYGSQNTQLLYSSYWSNSTKVTVAHVNASGSAFTNYPALINVSKEPEMQSNFDDIRFVTTGGDTMPFELEEPYTDYALFWVNVTTLPTSGTSFWMYYGNDAASSASDPESVWDSTYVMVQHLQESPANGTAGHIDSTSNDNDGTPQGFDGTTGSTTDGVGWIDGADQFDGVDDYVDAGNDASLDITDAITVSAWVKPSDVSKNPYGANTGYAILSKWLTTGNQRSYALMLCYKYDGGITTAVSSDGSNYDTRCWDYGMVAGTWYHIVTTRIGATNKVYVNGSDIGDYNSHLGAMVSSFYQSTSKVNIGRTELWAGNNNLFDGTIDEVRISNTARTHDYILQNYEMVVNQTTMVTFGATEAQPYHPPDPVNLANTTGNFWVDHTWAAGSGNVTDSYNVSVNGTWTNDSALTYMNVSVGSGGWANITVWAWNASGTGTLSAGCVSDEVQAPEALLTCTCSDICVNGTGWWRDNGVLNTSSTRIQHAIDNATAGDSIYVYNGSYTENVDVAKRLTLTGEGTDVVNVTNSTAEHHVFNVSADYVNISGFNVTGAAGNMKAAIYIGNGVGHCSISDNTVSDNNYGIYLNSSSSDNLFANNTISDNTWDLYIKSSASSFTNNTLSGTTINFTYHGDVSLKGVDLPASDPAGWYNITKFINATNHSAGAWLYLNFTYSDSDVSGLNESSLKVWKYNGTAWVEDGWNGSRYLDVANNVVGVNITSFSVFAPMAPQAPVFPGWNYHQLINISNTAQNLSYYPVRIDLNSSNVGTNWNWTEDENATRFTYYNYSTETETEIPFWIESWNSTAETSTIWVNVTFLANNTNTTIYLYYGNTSASSASNGTNTFEFFDDFDNTNNWEKQKFYSSGSDAVSFSASNSKLVITSSGDNRAGPITKAAHLSQGQKFEARIVTRSGSAQTIQLLYLSYGNTYENIPYASNVYEVWIGQNHVGTERYDGGSGSGDDVTSYPYIEYTTTDYVHFGTRETGEVYSEDSPWNGANFKLAFYTSALGTIEIDWVFVRKYAFPEPSVSISIPVQPLSCSCGDICVNATGWWHNNGTFNASDMPIQYAINNATVADSIYVYNGSYSENVNVTKQLSLQGEGPDVVNVTNSTAEHHVFNVTANYVNISGFNVTGATGNMKAGIYIGNDVDHCNISDNIGSNNYIGIYLNSSSSNNLFANNTISDNIWDLYIKSSASAFTNNTLNGTTVSLTYSGNVSLKGVGSPASDPTGCNSITKFINATNQSAGAWLLLNFTYSDSDVSGLNESRLKVWKYNGTAWVEDGWNGSRYLDVANNVVGVNITSFSVFAPMGSSGNPPAITLNKPDNGSTTSNNWAIVNATVTDADNDNMTVYFYANNNSNGLNASEGLVYIGENVANGTTLTYNLTALPIKPSEANLSLLMHFDNRSEFGEHTQRNVANAVYDFSGNGNNGRLGNATAGTAPTWNVTGGKFAGAFEFDGTDDFINCGNDPLLNITNNLTLEAWVNFDTTTNDYKGIVAKWCWGCGGGSYGLSKETGASNIFSFHIWNGSNSGILSDSVFATDTWYHVVGTYNGTTMLMYVNGVQQTQTLNCGNNIITSTSPVTIGIFDNNNNFCLDGTIDEVAIYNRTLSAEEILDHYRLGGGKYYWKANATDGVLSNESDVWAFSVFSETLEIRNQTASQSISSINFSGATGATVVDPYNIVDGSGSPQNISSNSPVVTIYNPSSSTDYKIWLKVTDTSGWSTIINDEKFNVTADDTSPGAVSSWTTLISWGSYKDTGETVSVGTHKDLYLAYELEGSGTGTSTVSVLGETV